jgi:hypothetical protein
MSAIPPYGCPVKPPPPKIINTEIEEMEDRVVFPGGLLSRFRAVLRWDYDDGTFIRRTYDLCGALFCGRHTESFEPQIKIDFGKTADLEKS